MHREKDRPTIPSLSKLYTTSIEHEERTDDNADGVSRLERDRRLELKLAEIERGELTYCGPPLTISSAMKLLADWDRKSPSYIDQQLRALKLSRDGFNALRRLSDEINETGAVDMPRAHGVAELPKRVVPHYESSDHHHSNGSNGNGKIAPALRRERPEYVGEDEVLYSNGLDTRRRIFERLKIGEMSIEDGASSLQLSGPTVTNHLRQLIALGLARVTRTKGRKHFYGRDHGLAWAPKGPVVDEPVQKIEENPKETTEEEASGETVEKPTQASHKRQRELEMVGQSVPYVFSEVDEEDELQAEEKAQEEDEDRRVELEDDGTPIIDTGTPTVDGFSFAEQEVLPAFDKAEHHERAMIALRERTPLEHTEAIREALSELNRLVGMPDELQAFYDRFIQEHPGTDRPMLISWYLASPQEQMWLQSEMRNIA